MLTELPMLHFPFSILRVLIVKYIYSRKLNILLLSNQASGKSPCKESLKFWRAVICYESYTALLSDVL